MKTLCISKKTHRQLSGGALEVTAVTSNVTSHGNVTCHKKGQVVGRIYTYPTIYAGISLYTCFMSDGIKTVLY